MKIPAIEYQGDPGFVKSIMPISVPGWLRRPGETD
jgi:hypothetical protein